MCGRANFSNIPWGKFEVEAPGEFTEADRKVLLQPVAENTLDFWPVSRAVGNARNNGAELIQRLPG